MDVEKETLEFYNQIVNDFASRTVSADMSEEQGRFTACLPEGALILDFGVWTREGHKGLPGRRIQGGGR